MGRASKPLVDWQHDVLYERIGAASPRDTVGDVKCQTIFNWIRQLGLPAPDYGFTLERVAKSE